jgi:hypothetical protein
VLEALESGAPTARCRCPSAAEAGRDEDVDPMETIGTIEHEYEVSEDRAVLEPGPAVLDERERKILHCASSRA